MFIFSANTAKVGLQLLTSLPSAAGEQGTLLLGFGVWGLGFGVWSSGLGIWGLGLRIQDLRFRIEGLVLVTLVFGFQVKGPGFQVYGFWAWVQVVGFGV